MLADLARPRGRRAPTTYRTELAWREFYADVLAPAARHRARLPPAASSRGWSTTSPARSFDAWRRGRTGFPIVDAGMRQLRATGWMHNRVRMIVGQLPGQGPARRVAARRPALHAAGWSTATSPPTSTAGSGRPAAAPTPRRTSGSSTRSPRAGSSTPTAPTSGAGCPSSPTPRTPTTRDPRTATRGRLPGAIVDHARAERREALDRSGGARIADAGDRA